MNKDIPVFILARPSGEYPPKQMFLGDRLRGEKETSVKHREVRKIWGRGWEELHDFDLEREISV